MCTSIVIKSQDGGFVSSRTEEFGLYLECQTDFFPAGQKYNSIESFYNKKGYDFETKYAFVGITANQIEFVVDGMNEKGFYVGCLYLPHFSDFPELGSAPLDKSTTVSRVVMQMLGQCTTVDEAALLAKSVCITSPENPTYKTSWPIHFVISDAMGNSKIMEFCDKETKIYDNEVGVLTNAPEYPWHLTNLRNYMNIHAHAYSEYELANLKIQPLGDGTGGLGLPGDYTPPSRFVRATAFRNAILPQKTTYDAVQTAFHILNNFDIPPGFNKPERGSTGIQSNPEHTLWTTSADQKELKYYWKTFETQTIEMVDLKELIQKYKEVTTMEASDGFTPKDRTNEMKPMAMPKV